MSDFTSSSEGTLVLLTVNTIPARDWVCSDVDAREHPPVPFTIPIDSRYFPDIAIGLLLDGLTLVDAATGRSASLPMEVAPC